MAQTGALQLRCCANKNSVTHNSFSLQIVKRSLFYSRKSSLATGTTRSTVSLGDFEPWKGTRERVKIKSFIIIRVRRQRSKKKAVTNGIIRDTLRSAVFEFSVLAAGYNGINHYRGEQVQPLNRDRWKPVTGAVAFLFFLSSPRKATVLLLPYVCAVPRHTFVLSNRSVNKIGTTIYARSLLEFLFLDRV